MNNTFKFLGGGLDNNEIVQMFHQCAKYFVENENLELYITPFKYQFGFHNIMIKELTYRPFPTLDCIGYMFVMTYQNHSRSLMHIKKLNDA